MTSYGEFVCLETVLSKPILTKLYHHHVHAHDLHGQSMLGSLSKATNEATKDVIDERTEMIFCFADNQLFLIEIQVGPKLLKRFGYRDGKMLLSISGKE